MPIPSMEDVKLHYIATSIKKKKKVKAKVFTLPEGTKIMSLDEFQAMMGR